MAEVSSSLPAETTLVQALTQLGAEITSEPDIVLAMLARFEISEAKPPTDEHLVSIITQLGRMAAEGPVSCDVRTLVRVLCTLVSL